MKDRHPAGVFREATGRVVASLVRHFGDIDVAEARRRALRSPGA